MAEVTQKRTYNAVFVDGEPVIDISKSTTDASEVVKGNIFFYPDGTFDTGTLDAQSLQSDYKNTDPTDGKYIQNKLPLEDRK